MCCSQYICSFCRNQYANVENNSLLDFFDRSYHSGCVHAGSGTAWFLHLLQRQSWATSAENQFMWTSMHGKSAHVHFQFKVHLLDFFRCLLLAFLSWRPELTFFFSSSTLGPRVGVVHAGVPCRLICWSQVHGHSSFLIYLRQYLALSGFLKSWQIHILVFNCLPRSMQPAWPRAGILRPSWTSINHDQSERNIVIPKCVAKSNKRTNPNNTVCMVKGPPPFLTMSPYP